MKIGPRFSTSSWIFVLALDNDYFSWTPGEAESGSNSPSDRFDAMSEEYWLYSFLFFTVFYARAGA